MDIIVKILQFLLSKFAKSHSEEIEKANLWVDKAQSQFQKMIVDAQKSEEHLEKIAQEAREKIEEFREVLNQAYEDKDRTTNFKSKVQEFIGE